LTSSNLTTVSLFTVSSEDFDVPKGTV
jgi:hypothetical protein